MTTEKHLIGPYLRRFLIQETLLDRNLSRNTQASYRDTFVLLLRFMEERRSISPERLSAEDVTVAAVREFLTYLKEDRGNGDSTRNQRLAAIHSLFRFMARETPELVALSTQVNEVPPRKTVTRTIPYMEKDEIEAVLQAPDRTTAQGRREHALMLFLYNTGARADEAAQLAVGNVEMGSSPYVRILGKGKKERLCPLWAQMVKVLREMLEERPSVSTQSRVFLNARGEPITRFGIRGLVKRLVARAARTVPSLKMKRISTHGIRHTTAVHLLRAGVDINTIRAWLGHVSLDTTNKYTEVDLKMKAEALQTTSIPVPHAEGAWGDKRKRLMAFLGSLARPTAELCDAPRG
jgi:integrase/recombinase XerD